jgi:hypothetical protein
MNKLKVNQPSDALNNRQVKTFPGKSANVRPASSVKPSPPSPPPVKQGPTQKSSS